MYRIIIFITFKLIFICNILCTEIDLQKGAFTKIESRTVIIDSEEALGSFWILRQRDKSSAEYYLDIYGLDNLELIESIPLSKELGSKYSKFDPFGLHYLDSKLILFFSYYDRTSNEMKLMGLRIGLDGIANESIREYAKINAIGVSNTGYFTISFPQNGFVLIRKNIPGTKKDEVHKEGIVVLDNNLNLVYSKIIDFPYKSSEFHLEDFVYTDNGVCYFLAFIAGSKKLSKYSRIITLEDNARTYKLFKIDMNNNEIEQKNIDFEDKYVRESILIFDTVNENIICTGTYFYETRVALEGMFYISYDSEFQEKTSNIAEFDESFVNKISEPRDIGVSYSYGIQYSEIVDGNVLMILEKEWFEINYSSDGSVSGYSYNNDDVIFCKLNSFGDYEQINWLPKRQSESHQDLRYNHFAYLRIKEKRYILFNEHKLITDGVDLDYRKPLKKKQIQLKLAEVSTENPSRSIIESFSETKTLMRGTFYYQLNDGSYLIFVLTPGIGTDNTALCRVTFK